MIELLPRLCRLMLVLATAFGVALTAFVALSAIMRYVVGQPFGFTEELVGLLFSALVFLALPYVTVYRRHICITLVTDLFSTTAKRLADAAGNLLLSLYCVWFGYYAFDFAKFSFELNSRTDLANIVLWPWMSFMVLASILMAVAAGVLVYRNDWPQQGADTAITDEF